VPDALSALAEVERRTGVEKEACERAALSLLLVVVEEKKMKVRSLVEPSLFSQASSTTSFVSIRRAKN